ncbi:MAG: hypothetical protein Q8O72_17990 [Bacteroidales bacterium]|nr:hypothetical protein [Bacteroidales bacterium]
MPGIEIPGYNFGHPNGIKTFTTDQCHWHDRYCIDGIYSVVLRTTIPHCPGLKSRVTISAIPTGLGHLPQISAIGTADIVSMEFIPSNTP